MRLWSGFCFSCRIRTIYIYIYISKYIIKSITKRYLGVIPHSFFDRLPSGVSILAESKVILEENIRAKHQPSTASCSKFVAILLASHF